MQLGLRTRSTACLFLRQGTGLQESDDSDRGFGSAVHYGDRPHLSSVAKGHHLAPPPQNVVIPTAQPSMWKKTEYQGPLKTGVKLGLEIQQTGSSLNKSSVRLLTSPRPPPPVLRAPHLCLVTTEEGVVS